MRDTYDIDKSTFKFDQYLKSVGIELAQVNYFNSSLSFYIDSIKFVAYFSRETPYFANKDFMMSSDFLTFNVDLVPHSIDDIIDAYKNDKLFSFGTVYDCANLIRLLKYIDLKILADFLK